MVIGVFYIGVQFFIIIDIQIELKPVNYANLPHAASHRCERTVTTYR